MAKAKAPVKRSGPRTPAGDGTAAAAAVVGARRNEPLEIAGRTIRPGERVAFDLPGAQLYTHTPLDMPVEVIHGRMQGPRLLVCAAIHGDELNGVEIIRRLRAMKVLNRLHGTLVLVPVVNLFGFIHRSRYLPDRRDLNRCFPGHAEGSLGSRVAHLFFAEVASRCTHVIDLHTGAVHRDNLPQLRAALDQPQVEDMARSFAMPVIVNAGLIEGSLRYAAHQAGIPVITYEAGEALRLDERCIVAGVRGVTGVMRGLGMLPGRRRRWTAEPYVARSTTWYRAPTDGMFRPLAKLGARVRRGDTLGVIAAPFGGTEHYLKARGEGIVIGANNLPLVNEGEALYHVARFAAHDAVEEQLSAQQEALEQDRLFEIERIVDL
ncbi:MAG: succinylglutamate desuccinylase/aspartoacylase family protein [Pseudomonadales bacterium]